MINITLANSIDSYYSKETQTRRLTQKDLILNCLKSLGKATQRELSEYTGIPRHLVPDRLLRLQAEKKVTIISTKEDSKSHKTVAVYCLSN